MQQQRKRSPPIPLKPDHLSVSPKTSIDKVVVQVEDPFSDQFAEEEEEELVSSALHSSSSSVQQHQESMKKRDFSHSTPVFATVDLAESSAAAAGCDGGGEKPSLPPRPILPPRPRPFATNPSSSSASTILSQAVSQSISGPIFHAPPAIIRPAPRKIGNSSLFTSTTTLLATMYTPLSESCRSLPTPEHLDNLELHHRGALKSLAVSGFYIATASQTVKKVV